MDQRSTLSSLTVRHTHLNAFCRAAWPCVQTLVCSNKFPLVSPLPSTTSASPGAPKLLFGVSLVIWGCPTSHNRSLACPLRVLRTDLGDPCRGQIWDLPVPVKGVSIHAQGLRPRRVRTYLAIAIYPMLPSALSHNVSTPKLNRISRLNTWPACTPVNASAVTLLSPPHDSGPV